MVVRAERFRTGVDLQEGDTLEGSDYDLDIDTSAEELYEEFREELLSEIYAPIPEDDTTLEETVARFVDEEIPHIYDIAENRSVDPEKLDRERRESQYKIGRVKLSKVLEGEWEDIRAGTCRERAATLHMLYKHSGVKSKYHSGAVSHEDNDGHSWVEVGNRMIADPSTEELVFPKEEGPHKTKMSVVRRNY